MKKVIRIDETGMFVEDVILTDEEATPSDCVDVECPAGFYKPKWNGAAWIEGLTQTEINTIVNVPKEPSSDEIIMLAIAELDAQREADKLETQLAIAELAETITGGVA